MTTPGAKIWFDGSLIDWDQATLHVMSHVVGYGSSVFDGIRCYETEEGSAIFRLHDHLKRLQDSCKICQIELRFTAEELATACLDTVRANGFSYCYIRPTVLRGVGAFGVDPTDSEVNTYVITWQWGEAYLGPGALEKGVPVCVSSWNRFAPNTMPAMAKSSGNYLNSQLIKLEARRHGYVEGIALDPSGFVSEGSAENVFIVRKGVLITPPLMNSVLPGITRDAIILLASDLGIPCEVRTIPREELYICDELMLVGTATEIVPVTSVDGRPIGDGLRGDLTAKLQNEFVGITTGNISDRHGWLTHVPATATRR